MADLDIAVKTGISGLDSVRSDGIPRGDHPFGGCDRYVAHSPAAAGSGRDVDAARGT